MCIKGGKKCKTRPNNASYNCKNIMKKQFLGSWEGLERQKLVQNTAFFTGHNLTKKPILGGAPVKFQLNRFKTLMGLEHF